MTALTTAFMGALTVLARRRSYVHRVPPILLEAETEHLRALLIEVIGDVRLTCAEASMLLALRLREQGVRAQVIAGSYAQSQRFTRVLTGHAHVLADGWICDPTREQFDDGPLVILRDAPEAISAYVSGSHWEARETPPAQADRDLTGIYLDYRCDCDLDYRAQMAEIAGLLGFTEIAHRLDGPPTGAWQRLTE